MRHGETKSKDSPSRDFLAHRYSVRTCVALTYVADSPRMGKRVTKSACDRSNNNQRCISLEQLQRVHTALRIVTPLDQASPMLLSTLTIIAHCWRDRIPTNLWRDADHVADQRGRTGPAVRQSAQKTTDLKRRAAGDTD
jgi:hypothetical protein